MFAGEVFDPKMGGKRRVPAADRVGVCVLLAEHLAAFWNGAALPQRFDERVCVVPPPADGSSGGLVRRPLGPVEARLGPVEPGVERGGRGDEGRGADGASVPEHAGHVPTDRGRHRRGAGKWRQPGIG